MTFSCVLKEHGNLLCRYGSAHVNLLSGAGHHPEPESEGEKFFQNRKLLPLCSVSGGCGGRVEYAVQPAEKRPGKHDFV